MNKTKYMHPQCFAFLYLPVKKKAFFQGIVGLFCTIPNLHFQHQNCPGLYKLKLAKTSWSVDVYASNMICLLVYNNMFCSLSAAVWATS